ENIRKVREGCEQRKQTRIPRKVFQIKDKKQIHVFTDASEVAYAAAVCIRSEGGYCSLVCSNSRLRPIRKNLTVPKKELLRMLIGVRTLKFVMKELEECNVNAHTWT
ncbi:hypothetical protein Tcan_00959, partial [Toxocara canis]